MDWWSLVLLFVTGQALFETTSSQFLCACDLNPGVCETNCCCDNDCSEDEKLTFEYCINTPPPVNDSECYYSRVEYSADNQPELVNISIPGLFCLTKNNYNQLLYDEVVCNSSIDCFENASLSSYPFEVDILASPDLNQSSFISNGEYLTANYSGIGGYFMVPGSMNGYCKDNPVQYLVSQSSTCVRWIENVTGSCSSDENLKPSTYYTDILIRDIPVTLSACILSKSDVNCDLYPVASSGCEGVVKSVTYTILTTQYGDIASVTCQIVLDEITTLEPLYFEQKFSVNFITELLGVNSTDGSIELSGNPGYIFEKPIIALTYNDTLSALVSPDISISLLNSDFSGICNSTFDNNERRPLLFGIDMQTQCKMPFFSNTLCQTLLTYTLYALEESTVLFNDGSAYVASFGNFTPSIDNVIANVVPIVRSGLAPTYSDSDTILNGCPGMIVGAHFTVAFAKAGDPNNPQNKIVGVKYEYETINLLSLTCFSKDCLTKEHSFTVSMSVSYVDVSEELTPVYKTLVPIVISLPDDFLFPFMSTTTSSASVLCSSCLTVLFFILCYLMSQ